MQRSHSAADFSNLLNPESPESTMDRDRPHHDPMSGSIGMIRPNGPLPPAGQAAVDANELPRPYKCPLCDKAFHRLEHQTRHIRTHTGEKPHACQFPGCTKRFSRSDELTRHSRIHSNPNSRRGAKGQMTHQGMMHNMQPEMMPPPQPKAIRSAPPTAISSPNVSPPHYSSYNNYPSAPGLHPYAQTRGSAGSQSGPDMGMLMRAAMAGSQGRESHPVSHGYYPPSRQHAYQSNAAYAPRMPGLQAYQMSRSHSNDDQEDHYGQSYRNAKRSRPNSPLSTAPSSPTFSHDSLSPTPDHTPLATPAHSPRLRPMTGIELPPFRHLSIHPHNVPALAPLEPQPEGHFLHPHPQQPAPRSTGMSLTDIISREDGSQRKLPVPKVAVRDLLTPSDGYHTSGRSSSSNSLTGDHLM